MMRWSNSKRQDFKSKLDDEIQGHHFDLSLENKVYALKFNLHLFLWMYNIYKRVIYRSAGI